jgi:hypothetical protein
LDAAAIRRNEPPRPRADFTNHVASLARSPNLRHAFRLIEAPLSRAAMSENDAGNLALLILKRVLAAFLTLRQILRSKSGSHKTLERTQVGPTSFSLSTDSEEIDPKMLARIAQHPELTPSDI